MAKAHQSSTAESVDGQKPVVVGLGASAGGIAALKKFFAGIDVQSGCTYVVILHLSPDHDSKLAEVLQVAAPIPVTQVKESVRIERDHVYVISPNRALEIAQGHLVASEIRRTEQRKAPVDAFLRTLADAYGSRSICVILSGTGSNGSSGLKRVKEYGGLVIAQDPAEAEYTDMPNNAIATGLVDLVLPIAQMPQKIADYVQQLRDAEAPELLEPADPDALREILTLVRVRTGHDFSNYKPATVARRVQRRMHLGAIGTLAAYARTIRERPDEAVGLMKDLLISVTHFFRDPATFNVIESRVIPHLFENKHHDDQIRIWVPGCATGEEAYSLAILASEYSGGLPEKPTVQVFATDLDEAAIAAARDGLYTNADVADLSDARLERFFQRETMGYRVRRELRELVLFANHNLIKDPPFLHLDFISCRNLLIYLNRAAQDQVIETFNFALRPGGYLLLGPSESPDGGNEMFITVDRNVHLYESRMIAHHGALRTSPVGPPLRSSVRIPQARSPERFAPLDAHHRLLEEYAPPSIVVTEDHSIVHMSARAGRFLQFPPGEPTRDILKLARPELRAELRTGLYQAMKQRSTVEVANIPLAVEGVERRVDLTIRPVLEEDDAARGYFLLLFADHDGADDPRKQIQTLERPSEPLTSQLEEELSRLKSQLRTTIEQYEAQVEEAQASAEEQQATNEELRSAAEELETSKEELQSVNEELTTVNQELKIKIEELRQSNNDFQNLIISTDLGTIFLDRSLRVKLTTPRASDVFNLLRSDTGRRLSDITSRLVYDHLEDDLRLVLEKLQPVDREVQTVDNRWFLMRIRPYRTSDDRIDGIVLMFQDITDRRQAESGMEASEQRLRLLSDSAADYAIFTITGRGLIASWSSGAQRMFGYSADEIVGRPFDQLFTQEDRDAGQAAAELERARRDGRALDERFHVRRDGSLFYCSGVTTRLGGDAGSGFTKIARDLTAQRHAAQTLREAHAELEQRVADRTMELVGEVRDREAAQAQVTNLLRRVVTAQEEERGRIARNLHDQMGQRLTALRLMLERMRGTVRRDGQPDAAIDEALSQLEAIDSEIGFLAWELRPASLDHLGLSAALPRYIQEWAAHYGLEAKYQGEPLSQDGLLRDVEVALYRLAQEAMTNVAKHAHATRVDVILEERNGAVVLLIEDDGVGFDAEAPDVTERGIGLAGMKERASLIGANFEVESKIGHGTSIYVRYPIRRGEAGP
jgi:two-component system CheB/CheR fusion protein